MTCPLHHQKPAQPDDGYQICQHHITALSETLYQIALLLPDLDELITTPPPTDTNDRRAIRTDPPAPCRPNIVDLPDPPTHTPALHIIGEWTRLVIDERRLANTPTQPETQTRLLLTNLDWLARHETAAEFAHEINQVSWWIRQAAGLTPPPPLFTCPIVDTETGQPCGGPVRSQTWTFGARCSKCGRTWDGHLEVRRLGLIRENT
mgnify:FL=1